MTLAQIWSITTTAAHGRKVPTNNCTKYIGQNKSRKSGHFCVTKLSIAITQPMLPSFGISNAIIQLVFWDHLVTVAVPYTIFVNQNKLGNSCFKSCQKKNKSLVMYGPPRPSRSAVCTSQKSGPEIQRAADCLHLFHL